jgi:hypothetical protein
VVCLFSPNYSPFARYSGYENFKGAKYMRGLGFIFIKFQSLDVMYFPIFEGCESSGVFIFA